jgi:hypothetical protein
MQMKTKNAKKNQIKQRDALQFGKVTIRKTMVMQIT